MLNREHPASVLSYCTSEGLLLGGGCREAAGEHHKACPPPTQPVLERPMLGGVVRIPGPGSGSFQPPPPAVSTSCAWFPPVQSGCGQQAAPMHTLPLSLTFLRRAHFQSVWTGLGSVCPSMPSGAVQQGGGSQPLPSTPPPDQPAPHRLGRCHPSGGLEQNDGRFLEWHHGLFSVCSFQIWEYPANYRSWH